MPKAREPNALLDPIADRALARARNSLAANMREQRARSGLTQERVAELSGLSVIYVRALERAAPENPTLRSIALLAHVLGCDIADLIVVRPAPKPRPPGRPPTGKPEPVSSRGRLAPRSKR